MSVERDSHGLWLKGSVPNPAGRRAYTIEKEYLSVLLGQCSLERWTEICRVAVSDAISGNVNARRYAREWLARIVFPAIERILIASFNVGIDVSDSRAQLDKLIAMLTGLDDNGKEQ